MFIFFSRSIFVLFAFYVILILVICFSLKNNLGINHSVIIDEYKDDSSVISEFNQVDYYSKKNDKPYIYLNARTLLMNHTDNLLNIQLPSGNTFSNDNTPVSYQANSGMLNLSSKDLTLIGDVIVWDNLSELKSDKLIYIQNKDLAIFEGNIRSHSVSEKSGDQIFINALKAFAWPSKKEGEYVGHVTGEIIRAKRYEPGINFRTDQLKAYLNKSYIELNNNVYIKRDNMEAFAMKGEIFLENYNKKLKYYVLFDDVKVVQHLLSKELLDPQKPDGPKKPNDRIAYSEKLEGFAKEAKIVLTGYPKVIHEQDVVKGNKITFFENTEMIEVDDSTSSFIISK
ncbi:MAG: LPS export ABC transporter periplasmic protein LptC [Oligoflexia bacterium]|nr:LPS export ABC transporter periplasmic protein LptC [Oligoflexia bacterium]